MPETNSRVNRTTTKVSKDTTDNSLTEMPVEKGKIDESLYSRQLYAIGRDAMMKMADASVLITCSRNFSGPAIELAKCVVLAGVQSVTLHSNTDVLTHRDLASNYYVTANDVNTPFFDKVTQNIASLNPNVKVTNINLLTEAVVKSHTCVVFCDYDVHNLFFWNRKCRESGVKFIMLQTYGLTFNMFCDFGDEHVVIDKDGEPAKTGFIASVSNSKIKTTDAHNIFSGDVVQFEGEIAGLSTDMTGQQKQYLVKTVNSHEFELREFREDHKSMDALARQIEMFKTVPIIIPDQKPISASFKQIKLPSTMRFKSLREALDDPEYVMVDTVDWDMPKILNNFMKALSLWRIDNKFVFAEESYVEDVWTAYPVSEDDYASLKVFFDLMIKTSKSKDKLQPSEHVDKVFDILARTCVGSVCGVDAVAGSICAQEVIKAVSNKFTPTNQFMHFESLNILPDNYLELRRTASKTFEPVGSRYDGQIVVFGTEYMDKLRKQNIFVVGSGAIGCEHLKNFTMMGVNSITVTDMDSIENSNLNRQFLFRREDIGQPKSVVAARKAQLINSDVKIVAHENKVCKETTNIYNPKFFEEIDVVANALDNVEARIFVDSLCVRYRKPLLESGTLGTKGSIQSVIPDLTESYSALRDPPEQSIAVCTLKLFPYKYEHVVQYARDVFEGYFTRTASNLTKARDLQTLKTMTPSEVSAILEDVRLLAKNCANFKYCINLAYKQWHTLFRDPINQIIQKYPKDHVDDEGNPFWSGNKMFPKAFNFNLDDQTDVDFVVAFSHIWADLLGIPQNKRYDANRRDRFVKFLKRLAPPREVVCKDVGSQTSDNKDQQRSKRSKTVSEYETTDTIEQIQQLLTISKDLLRNVSSVTFEKDDDTNHHIDFVTALANKRAMNYHIEPKDRLTTKGIAGKIIPAIATTTSIVSGLVALELYKTVYGDLLKRNINTLHGKPVQSAYNTLQRYRYGSFNLAVQLFGFSESYPPKFHNIDGKYYSIWSHIEVDPDEPLQTLLDNWTDVMYQKDNVNTNMTVDFISDEKGVIYSHMAGMVDDEGETAEKTLRDLILQNNKTATGDYYLSMSLEKDDDESDDDEQNQDAQDVILTVKVSL